jgi:mannose-6-phosphate isomerase-like protein (cupin superfamily)
MIVRSFDDPEVVATTYRAHGGGVARMLFDQRQLQDLLFLAQAFLEPGHIIEAHVDPYEEIYIITAGGGRMRVGDEVRPVEPGQSIWIPLGEVHELYNDRSVTCHFLVVAGPWRDYREKL